MKHKIKRILLVSTFMLTASHAANPVDLTNAAGATPAAAAVQVTAAEYPSLPSGHVLKDFHSRIVSCLKEYEAAQKKYVNGLGDLRYRIETLTTQLSEAEAHLTQTESASNRVQRILAQGLPETLTNFQSKYDDIVTELRKTVTTLKTDLSAAEKTVSREDVLAFMLMIEASNYNGRHTNSNLGMVIHAVKQHNDRGTSLPKEIRDLQGKAQQVTLNNHDTYRLSQAQEELKNHKMVEIPIALQYLWNFSQTMDFRLDSRDNPPLISALGYTNTKGGISCPIDGFFAGDKISTWKKAPYFGDNTLKYKAGAHSDFTRGAPSFLDVLRAMREFAQNPNGSESGPAAA